MLALKRDRGCVVNACQSQEITHMIRLTSGAVSQPPSLVAKVSITVCAGLSKKGRSRKMARAA